MYLIPYSIFHNVCYYIGWDCLSRYKNISDGVWEYICDSFCQDDEFRKQFNVNREDTEVLSYRFRFLWYINSLVGPVNGNLPNILRSNKDYIKFKI